MNEDSNKKSGKNPEIAQEETIVLARALLRVQTRKSDDKADKAELKEARAEMRSLARRTLKNLKKQGYSLTKS